MAQVRSYHIRQNAFAYTFEPKILDSEGDETHKKCVRKSNSIFLIVLYNCIIYSKTLFGVLVIINEVNNKM